MKCSMAEDLLPLYVDEICSEETKKEVEEHLATCEKCSEKLKNYKTAITMDESEQQVDQKEAPVVKSMRKVKKKLAFRKFVAIVSTLLLLAVVICVGTLVVGERTGNSMNFTTLSNLHTLKKISKAVCERNFEPLLEMTHYDLNVSYVAKKFLQDGDPTIEELQRRKLEQAFQDVFGEEKVSYEITDIEYIYENKLSSGVSGEPEGWNYRNPSAAITIRYFSDSAEMLVSYIQMGDRKFDYAGGYFASEENQTFECIQGDDLVIQYVSAAARNGSNNPNVWSMLILEKPENMETRTTQYVAERVSSFYDTGWKIQDVLFAVDGFDMEQICLIYRVQFTLQNENGDCAIMEQRFNFEDSRLLIRAGEQAKMLLNSEAMTEEVEELALGMFYNEAK